MSRCPICYLVTPVGACARVGCPQSQPISPRAREDRELLAEVEAWLRRKYVQRADDRQKAMGLSYTTAETKDLAREIARFIREREE